VVLLESFLLASHECVNRQTDKDDGDDDDMVGAQDRMAGSVERAQFDGSFVSMRWRLCDVSVEGRSCSDYRDERRNGGDECHRGGEGHGRSSTPKLDAGHRCCR
jgi:hypothetical protein